MRLTSYASDVLEDAMQLAQTKALNSFSFRDCINTLTELWGQCYELIAQIDSGFYSKTIQLTERITRLPPFLRSVINVYHAQEIVGFNRVIFKQSGNNDINSSGTFHISGNDLYCPDAERRIIWCEYVPEPPFVTFTKNNRDPKLFTTAPEPEEHKTRYGMYDITGAAESTPYAPPFTATHKMDSTVKVDITPLFEREGYTIIRYILDFPYVFMVYQQDATDDYESWIFKDVMGKMTRFKYNPYDFTGRQQSIEIIRARYNDYTGMGVVVCDHFAPEQEQYKELGWTPDTLLTYPTRVMYNYLVASLAKRLAEINGGVPVAVESALVAAKSEIAQHLRKNQSAFYRINNVTGPTASDFL